MFLSTDLGFPFGDIGLLTGFVQGVVALSYETLIFQLWMKVHVFHFSLIGSIKDFA